MPDEYIPISQLPEGQAINTAAGTGTIDNFIFGSISPQPVTSTLFSGPGNGITDLPLNTGVTGILPNANTTAEEFNGAGNTPFSIASRDMFGELFANSANTALLASQVGYGQLSSDATCYISFFANSGPGFASPNVNTGLLYNSITNEVSVGSIVLGGDPTTALQATTKSYVDNLITGLTWKPKVAAATTANITLSGEQTIDGVTTSNSRVLVKNQSNQTENGLYLSSSGAWTRTTDADTGAELSGAAVLVNAGTTNANTQWVCSNTSITIGVTNITFAQIAGAGVYTNGTGITLTGNVFSIANNAITNALLRQSAGLSIIGNASNSTANVADITAGTDGQVLRRSGTTLAFGSVNLAAAAAVTGVLPNANTTAASNNTALAIVARDSLGGFGATSITLTGNLTLASTGQRILGNFSNATRANRLLLQTSLLSSRTSVGAIPTSGASFSSFDTYGLSDPDNSSYMQAFMDDGNALCGLNSAHTGTGTTRSMAFQFDGVTQASLATNGALTLAPTTNQLVLGTTRTLTISAPTPATSSRTGTVSDFGADFVFAQGTAGNNCFFTTSGNTNVTLPTSGILTTLATVVSTANTYTAAQRCAFVTLTDAATVAVDLSLGNNFNLTLGGNRTLGAPTNVVAGQNGLISVRQDSTGSRTLAYSWVYEFGGGAAPTLSTGKFALDQLYYNVNNYATSTVTMTIATPCVVTWTSHGLISGQKIQLTTTGALPTGLSINTTYWVNVTGVNTFNLSSSLANLQAGTFIATSGSQSGTHTAVSMSITISANFGIA